MDVGTNRRTLSPLQKADLFLQRILLCLLRLPGLITIDLLIRFLIGRSEFRKNLHSITKFQNEFSSWTRYVEFTKFARSRNFDAVLENVIICSGKLFDVVLPV